MNYKSDNSKLQQEMNNLASRMLKLSPEKLNAPASCADLLILIKALLDTQRQSGRE